MAISQYDNEYYGLSGDVKPLGTPLNGRKFTEMDTSKEYRFDAENQQWLQQSGGGGGSSTLSGLTDVDISNPTDGQTLVYNATTGKWENGAGGGRGALVVHAAEDGNNLVLDRTYAEIVAASPLVCLGAVDANHSAFIWLTAFGVMQGRYAVMFGNSQDDTFFTDTENGYPSQAGAQ